MELINHLELEQKNWAVINDDASGTYNTNNQVTFEATMIKSSLCDYSNACILAKEMTTDDGQGPHVVIETINK